VGKGDGAAVVVVVVVAAVVVMLVEWRQLAVLAAWK
jgi:hypothetical protein